jgi:glucose/arabinose dehydrogenase/PKD repeat protein
MARHQRQKKARGSSFRSMGVFEGSGSAARVSPESMRSLVLKAVFTLAIAQSGAFVAPANAGADISLPAGFQQRAVLTGLQLPTAVRFAPDGRFVFVAEKRGTIQAFEGLEDTTPTEVINLRREVFNDAERGLLGLEVDPEFPVRPFLYALYTRAASFAASTGAVPDDVPFHQDPAVADTTDVDPCPGLLGPTGCEASGRLVRIEINPETGVAISGTVSDPNPRPLVSGWCQQFASHTVDDLRFGADDQLYVSAGDGAWWNGADFGQNSNPCPDAVDEGGALRAQDASTTADPTGLNGAILRVDPDTGAASAGNPFSVGDENQRRIVGFGLRNPYRLAFRPGTSDLWIADVGLGRWEEIDRIENATRPAQNFGWPCYEGINPQESYKNASLTRCTSLYAANPTEVVAPFFSYYHTTAEGQCVPSQGFPDYTNVAISGAAITGLSFYTSGTYPSSYDGSLFFGDYVRGCIWAMGATDGIPDRSKIQTFASWDRATPDIGLVGLERGPSGDIFIVDIAHGAIRRLQFGAVDARAAGTPSSGSLPLNVTFDAASSTTASGATIVKYEWDLDGDGDFETDTLADPVAHATFTEAGVINVKVRVTDSAARTGISDPIRIEAGDKPSAVIQAPGPGSQKWATGDLITFSGKGYQGGTGTPLPESTLTWDLIIRHCTTSGDCHSHFAPGLLDGLDGGRHGTGGTFVAPDHSYPSHLELQLTVEDPNGLSTTVTRRLDPATIALSLASDPAGRTLTGNDQTGPAPFVCTVIKGSSATVSAALSEIAAGRTFTFDSWSNGGPATQTFIATEDQTLTARYSVSHEPLPAAAASAVGSLAAPFPAGQSAATRKTALRRTLRVTRRGIVGLRVRCRGSRACRVSVRLDTATGSSAATRRIAQRSVKRIAAGRSTTVYVRLSRAARRRLVEKRSLEAIATVTVTPRGRTGLTTRTPYTLRAASR